uniref:UBC core domain-containing protein n=1 Tax=Parastrongyloides trichosuri TaxID=131310 RepID=A0A0N4ZX86_PARTI
MAFMYPQNYPECPLLLTEPAWYPDDYPEKEELNQLYEQYKKDKNLALNIKPGTPSAETENDGDEAGQSGAGTFNPTTLRGDNNDEDEDNEVPPLSDEDE